MRAALCDAAGGKHGAHDGQRTVVTTPVPARLGQTHLRSEHQEPQDLHLGPRQLPALFSTQSHTHQWQALASVSARLQSEPQRGQSEKTSECT